MNSKIQAFKCTIGISHNFPHKNNSKSSTRRATTRRYIQFGRSIRLQPRLLRGTASAAKSDIHTYP